MKIIYILIRTFVTLDPSFDDTKENPASENSFSRTLSSYVSVHPKNDYFFHLHLAIRPIPFTNFNLFNLLFGRFPFAQLDLFFGHRRLLFVQLLCNRELLLFKGTDIGLVLRW